MAIKPVHRAVERLMRSAQIRRHKIRVLVGDRNPPVFGEQHRKFLI